MFDQKRSNLFSISQTFHNLRFPKLERNAKDVKVTIQIEPFIQV